MTAAERREVFGAASFRIVPRLQRPAFRVGAHSRLVLRGREPPRHFGWYRDVWIAHPQWSLAEDGVTGRDFCKPDEEKSADTSA